MVKTSLYALVLCITSIGYVDAKTTTAPLTASAATTTTASNPAVYNPSHAHAKKLDDIVLATMKHQNLPSISYAVVENYELVHAAAFGLSNISDSTSAGVLTKFNLGSVSKPITAVAAMQLVEKGKLDLSAPVQTYVPDFPAKEWPVTILSLLSHQSGIRHYKGMEGICNKRYAGVLEGLEIFKDDPLVCQPGTTFNYSSYGYNLLGATIQGAAREPYMQYLESNMFAPSEIDGMLVYNGTLSDPLQAAGYSLVSDQTVAATPFDTTGKIPSAGLVCSSMDLARFASAYMSGDLLSSQSMALMMEPQKLASGKLTTYGLGWFVTDWKSEKVVYHPGGQPGYMAQLLLVPEKGFAVAILSNLSTARLEGLSNFIRDQVLSNK